MDDRLLNVIEKRGGDPSLYLTIYEKCKTEQRLTGDEYHLGYHLFEWGFMQIRMTPSWLNGSYKGNSVYFFSLHTCSNGCDWPDCNLPGCVSLLEKKECGNPCVGNLYDICDKCYNEFREWQKKEDQKMGVK